MKHLPQALQQNQKHDQKQDEEAAVGSRPSIGAAHRPFKTALRTAPTLALHVHLAHCNQVKRPRTNAVSASLSLSWTRVICSSREAGSADAAVSPFTNVTRSPSSSAVAWPASIMDAIKAAVVFCETIKREAHGRLVQGEWGRG